MRVFNLYKKSKEKKVSFTIKTLNLGDASMPEMIQIDKAVLEAKKLKR